MAISTEFHRKNEAPAIPQRRRRISHRRSPPKSPKKRSPQNHPTAISPNNNSRAFALPNRLFKSFELLNYRKNNLTFMKLPSIKAIGIGILSCAALVYGPIFKAIKQADNVPPQVIKYAPEVGDAVNQAKKNADLFLDIDGFENLVKAGKLKAKKIFESKEEIKYSLEIQIERQLKTAHCTFKRNQQTDRLLKDIEKSDNFISYLIEKYPNHEKEIKKIIKKACA